MPMQHVGLGHSVIQNPPQHSIPKAQFLPNGGNQLLVQHPFCNFPEQ